jgi:hypothetical protein
MIDFRCASVVSHMGCRIQGAPATHQDQGKRSHGPIKAPGSNLMEPQTLFGSTNHPEGGEVQILGLCMGGPRQAVRVRFVGASKFDHRAVRRGPPIRQWWFVPGTERVWSSPTCSVLEQFVSVELHLIAHDEVARASELMRDRLHRHHAIALSRFAFIVAFGLRHEADGGVGRFMKGPG